jgi:hypothetical protein
MTIENKFDLVKGIVLSTLVVLILGYADYLTGEVSLDILYILCISAAVWFSGTLVGVLCVFEIVFAKISADYFDNIKVGIHFYEWNAFSDFIIFLFVCLLVGKLKRALTE